MTSRICFSHRRKGMTTDDVCHVPHSTWMNYRGWGSWTDNRWTRSIRYHWHWKKLINNSICWHVQHILKVTQFKLFVLLTEMLPLCSSDVYDLWWMVQSVLFDHVWYLQTNIRWRAFRRYDPMGNVTRSNTHSASRRKHIHLNMSVHSSYFLRSVRSVLLVLDGVTVV
jgi:hypothetical protein